MKRLLITIPIFLCITLKVKAQNTGCAEAVAQLQNYAAQINQFYYNEYWTIIPNVRCPAFDQWGRPFHPLMVQNCRNQTLISLNQWYGQQCIYINNWYNQIVRGCSVQPQSPTAPTPAPRTVTGTDESAQINTDQIKELKAGIDESKAVKITIPKTASGYRPRQ